MRTLIIGAAGQIGRMACELARGAGLDVRAMVRAESQAQALGVPTVVADLEGDFVRAFDGCEQVVFTAGSGPHTGLDKTLLVDLWGAIRSVDIAVERGVRHFIMVSAMRAAEPLAGPEKLRPYLAAKRAADLHLEQSGLRYTVLRPGRLVDDAATGLVTTEPTPAGTISRANVARCVVQAMGHVPAASRTIDLLDGTRPIADVLG